jgi:hypothetical protein
MPQPNSLQKATKPGIQAITKESYLSVAGFLEGRENLQRVHKKDPHGEALRKAGEMYERREFVPAYESFKPVYDKVVSDMQRILARSMEFEANKLAREQQKPLKAAKEHVQNIKAHAQQVIDQFQRLRQDLESKPLVRVHLKKVGSSGTAATPPAGEAPTTTANSAIETRPDPDSPPPPLDVVIGDRRYRKAAYTPPEKGVLYSVRDKSKGERIIRVIGKSPDGAVVQVETLKDGEPSKQPVQVAVDSLARQAARGWCSLLLPITEQQEAPAVAKQPAASKPTENVITRLDIQNFGRCCADIVRANIRFDTQLIKDVGDGPFRAGRYEQAFLTFEQCAVGFNSAVASSRQAIADGRRALTAEKGKLSGKEIQERSAAFVRGEQLIQKAQREFSTILEGLRMHLRAQEG